eukprot:16045480-Heterocapsa_arctica.AAC.1
MSVASPMVIARALSEHQQTSNNDFDRTKAKSKQIVGNRLQQQLRRGDAEVPGAAQLPDQERPRLAPRCE